MMHRFWILFLATLPITALAQTPLGQLRPDSLGVIDYPPIGRAARIEGDIKVRFRINALGNTERVEAFEGQELLRRATEGYVKQWHFSTLPAVRDRTVLFRYRLIPSSDGYWNEGAGASPTTVSFTDDETVIITVEGLQDRSKSHCPGRSETEIPERIQAGDFVELSRTGCFGTCPSYTVRVREDGRVLWDGGSFVKENGHRETTIPVEAAHALIEKFRSATFWNACGSYSRNVTDNPTYGLQATVGGRNKIISDYADSSPLAVQALQREIDDAANTHQWRHGSPERESFVNLGSEWFGKPGQTPLMRAAMGDKTFDLDVLLKEGADVNARDSSGWTPLMYAVAGYVYSDRLAKLLNSGADGKLVGKNNETLLMISALNGDFDEDLVRAGSPINAQTKDGLTALMLLAQRANPEEISDALRAGADAILKDHQGRTALDYLIAANCGKRIVAATSMQVTTWTRCNALDKDDVAKSKNLLLKAMRRKVSIVSAR